MKLNIILLIFLIIFNVSYTEDSIIQIPNKEGRFKNITTKNGFINYSFYSRNDDEICNMLFIMYRIEGIKNLHLFKLPNKTRNTQFNIYGKNNDSLEIIFLNEERDIYNPLICEIFYKTNYINKMIYSFGKTENNQMYKYFGGTPQDITKNLNKFIFSNNTKKISEIKIEFNDRTNYIINNFSNEYVEFREDEYSLICLPENILSQFKKIFLYKFEECQYNYKIFNSISIYKLNEEQKKFFPNITFKIEDNIIYLNQENAFWPKYIQDNIYLFINRAPCQNIVFGLKFLQLFDISEFDIQKGENILYLDKNKKYLIHNIDK